MEPAFQRTGISLQLQSGDSLGIFKDLERSGLPLTSKVATCLGTDPFEAKGGQVEAIIWEPRHLPRSHNEARQTQSWLTPLGVDYNAFTLIG